MVELPEQTRGGRHRRHEADVLLAVSQYEQLVVVLRKHKPSERAGLCLICGTAWPCVEVLLTLERDQTSGYL